MLRIEVDEMTVVDKARMVLGCELIRRLDPIQAGDFRETMESVVEGVFGPPPAEEAATIEMLGLLDRLIAETDAEFTEHSRGAVEEVMLPPKGDGELPRRPTSRSAFGLSERLRTLREVRDRIVELIRDPDC